MNDVPPKPYAEQPGDEDVRRFCPLGSVYETGPAGSWLKKLPPCDPEHCALADYGKGRCPIAQIPSLLLRLVTALEGISKDLAWQRPR